VIAPRYMPAAERRQQTSGIGLLTLMRGKHSVVRDRQIAFQDCTFLWFRRVSTAGIYADLPMGSAVPMPSAGTNKMFVFKCLRLLCQDLVWVGVTQVCVSRIQQPLLEEIQRFSR